ncbi:MAG TPA: 30S ribosomal protein S24e [Thermoplasmata archaeon]|nr:30S ribosomal protein S24e [Thermoplasmata archaeon]
MEIKIVETRKNPLLHRTEYRFEVDHPTAASPTRANVRQELAKMVMVPKDRLVVERMNAQFGLARSDGFAVAYETKEALDVTVREHILVRNGLREKKSATPPAAEEAPAPAAKAEAPAAAPATPKKE